MDTVTAAQDKPQLSPGNSLRMVAAFRPVPPACDSISNRKATFRRLRSFTTRSASPSQRGTLPAGASLASTRQLAMQTGLHRNTISKVYRQLETDGVVEAMAGSGIYVRDQQKPREIKTPPHIRNRGVTDLDREVRKCVDGLLNAGCTLQLTGSCSPGRSTGGCAAARACWSAHREKTSAPRC